MGVILAGFGPDAYEHEGYAAQVLDDGTLTSTYSNDTEPRMVGQVVAACGCGWTGVTRYPTLDLFDEAVEDLTLVEWERDHARPTLNDLRAANWERLHTALRELTASTRATMTGAQFVALPPADQVKVVEASLARLHRATELACQLRDSALTAIS